MVKRFRRSFLAGLMALACLAAQAQESPKAPPGINVHLVSAGEKGIFWRGAAPRKDTMQALAESAKSRGVHVLLVDLRHPALDYDLKSEAGRLTPDSEKAMAEQLGLGYLSISALDKQLVPRLQEALAQGDIYIHCMYGVNRTGFAVGRYATVTGTQPDRDGLGKKDWEDGVHFQKAQR